MTVATFDGQNRIVTLASGLPAASGVNITDAESEIYSEWKRWIAISDNTKFAPAFRTIGGDPLGGGVDAGAYFFLQNQVRSTAEGGWTIKPPEHSGDFEIVGNIFGEDATQPVFSGTSGTFNTSVRLTTSSLTQQVTADVGATSSGIAEAVWAQPIATETTPAGSFGEYVATKLLTVAKFLGLK
jgi:hypothetical protein